MFNLLRSYGRAVFHRLWSYLLRLLHNKVDEEEGIMPAVQNTHQAEHPVQVTRRVPRQDLQSICRLEGKNSKTKIQVREDSS